MQYVDAVSVLFDHPLDASDLTGDPFSSAEHLFLYRFIHVLYLYPVQVFWQQSTSFLFFIVDPALVVLSQLDQFSRISAPVCDGDAPGEPRQIPAQEPK